MSNEPYYVTFDTQPVPTEAAGHRKGKKKAACDDDSRKKKAGNTKMYNGLRITAGPGENYVYAKPPLRRPPKRKK